MRAITRSGPFTRLQSALEGATQSRMRRWLGRLGMIWIIGAALVLILGLALGAPMFSSRFSPSDGRAKGDGSKPLTGTARDLAVYQDQLRGIEADAASGRIGADEAASLRAEIGRRLLDADRALRKDARNPDHGGSGETGSAPGHVPAFFGLAGLVVILAGGLATYGWLGSPDLPDAPRKERIAAAQAQYEQRPTQAEAEAMAPEPPQVTTPEGFPALMEQLRARMAEQPEEQGLRMLADYEAQIGNLTAAHQALAQLIALKGPDAGADLHLARAFLMIDAAGGLITPEAEEALAASLALDPAAPQARFLQGLLLGQTGRPDRAFPIWRELLAEGPADAPWITLIRERIDELAWLAGSPDDIPAPGMGDGPGLPALDADTLAAAEAMTADERADLVAGMIAGLESRLATEGGPPEDWARLIISLAVSGEAGRARAIRDEARVSFADNPDAMAVIEAASTRAGLD